MKKNTIFIFDLDGTITAEETLPVIAKHFNIEAQIEKITRETIQGIIPFEESFKHRVSILGQLPVSEVAKVVESVKLYPQIVEFIKKNCSNSIITTGNLFCWVEKLIDKIGCKTYYSDAIVENNKVKEITKIIKKEEIVRKYREEGSFIVYIGDGNNDMEAMKEANIAIAVGMTHQPSRSLLPIIDYLIYKEETLCHQLNQLL